MYRSPNLGDTSSQVLRVSLESFIEKGPSASHSGPLFRKEAAVTMEVVVAAKAKEVMIVKDMWLK